jgi:hypothetical protein
MHLIMRHLQMCLWQRHVVNQVGRRLGFSLPPLNAIALQRVEHA